MVKLPGRPKRRRSSLRAANWITQACSGVGAERQVAGRRSVQGLIGGEQERAFVKTRRRNWARLVREVWLDDPELCRRVSSKSLEFLIPLGASGRMVPGVGCIGALAGGMVGDSCSGEVARVDLRLGPVARIPM